MTREEAYERLNEVFQDVFDDEALEVSDGTTAKDVEGWDSYQHINLLIAIEQEFDIKFSMGETVTMKNVGEMMDTILEKLEE